MPNSINADKLTAMIVRELNDYVEATDEMIKVNAQAVAKETVAQLRNTSPVNRHSSKGGEYAKSWAYKKRPASRGEAYNAVVYSKAPHYRLTHLLEKGHPIKRGGRVVGYSPAKPHIAPAEAKAIESFISKMKESIERGY